MIWRDENEQNDQIVEASGERRGLWPRPPVRHEASRIEGAVQLPVVQDPDGALS